MNTTEIYAKQIQELTPTRIREIILEQSMRAGVGHIGSALCVAEIIVVLYGTILSIPSPDDPARDRFILSKAHAALALYAALYLRGFLSKEELETYCGDGSSLGVHPESDLRGIDFSTGSLGQGLSFGVGAALAAKYEGSARRCYVLMSDAEMNEGSVWEAAMFAAHHKLHNLIGVVDLNGQQAFGYTRDVIDLHPLRAKWTSFGWDVVEVDGHNTIELADALSGSGTTGGAPRIVIAKTTFGRGVSFMENLIKWHYSPLTNAEYKAAMEEVRGQG